ncbi:MAG: hypothetical protein ICV63_01550 [Coleofasciculus sp. Co-bin14]|nr:hypothetical protein [Coleofasciculus sp. Co-bin14]
MKHELNHLEDLARRNNPDYTQVAGLINKDLARKLRVYCADQSVTIAEVMEEAIADYLERKQSQQNESPSSGTSSDKDRG